MELYNIDLVQAKIKLLEHIRVQEAAGVPEPVLMILRKPIEEFDKYIKIRIERSPFY